MTFRPIYLYLIGLILVGFAISGSNVDGVGDRVGYCIRRILGI